MGEGYGLLTRKALCLELGVLAVNDLSWAADQESALLGAWGSGLNDLSSLSLINFFIGG